MGILHEHREYDTAQLLILVSKLTEAYTSKESTSVTYEKASQLMKAVIYCIEEQDIADSLIKNESLQKSYELGYQMVLQKVQKAKELYEWILEDFTWYGNMACKETILDGMPSFFIHYDPKFNPQDHLLTLDYPVLIKNNSHEGIDVIYEYLLCVRYEQMFLHFFPEQTVEDLLYRYHHDYKELIINIPSIVVRNVLGSMILKKDQFDFRYTREDHTRLMYFIEMNTQVEAETKLTSLLHVFLKDFIKIPLEFLPDIQRYFIKDLPDFQVLFRTAAESGHLDAIFPN